MLQPESFSFCAPPGGAVPRPPIRRLIMKSTRRTIEREEKNVRQQDGGCVKGKIVVKSYLIKKGVAAVISHTGQRTDSPAFYAKRLASRLKAGFAGVQSVQPEAEQPLPPRSLRCGRDRVVTITPCGGAAATGR